MSHEYSSFPGKLESASLSLLCLALPWLYQTPTAQPLTSPAGPAPLLQPACPQDDQGRQQATVPGQGPLRDCCCLYARGPGAPADFCSPLCALGTAGLCQALGHVGLRTHSHSPGPSDSRHGWGRKAGQTQEQTPQSPARPPPTTPSATQLRGHKGPGPPCLCPLERRVSPQQAWVPPARPLTRLFIQLC